MKRILLALSLLATPAFAQTKAPEPVVLPPEAVAAMIQYLNSRPRGEIENLAVLIEACTRVQTPNDRGMMINRGECPAINSTLELISKGRGADALQKKVEDLQKQVDAATPAEQPKP